MKKLLLIAMVLTMALTLGACRKNVTAKSVDDLNWSEEKQEYVNEKGAKLVLWGDSEDFSERVIALWNAKYPDVQLTFEEVSTTEAVDQLQLDGPAGIGGDVFFMPHDNIVNARESGLLFEFHSRDKAYITGLMHDSANDVTIHENIMYAAPSSIENIALAYNKNILAKLPACASTITSTATTLLEQIENEEIYLEELLQCVATMGNNFAGAGILADLKTAYPSVFADEDYSDKHSIMGWQVFDAYHNYLFLTKHGYRVFGPDNDDYSKFDITSDSVTKSIEEVMGSIYGNSKGSQLFPGLALLDDLNWDNSVSNFQKGSLGMTITGPWVMGDIMNESWPKWLEDGTFGITADTKYSDVFGVTKLPSFDNDVQPTTFSGVQVTAMNIYTEYPNAAMNLMRFLVSEDVMREVYVTLGKIPAVVDSDDIPGLKDDAIAQGFLSQSEFSHAMPVIAEVTYMWEPLRDVWAYIFDEDQSIELAQARALADYQRALINAGRN